MNPSSRTLDLHLLSKCDPHPDSPHPRVSLQSPAPSASAAPAQPINSYSLDILKQTPDHHPGDDKQQRRPCGKQQLWFHGPG